MTGAALTLAAWAISVAALGYVSARSGRRAETETVRGLSAEARAQQDAELAAWIARGGRIGNGGAA